MEQILLETIKNLNLEIERLRKIISGNGRYKTPTSSEIVPLEANEEAKIVRDYTKTKKKPKIGLSYDSDKRFTTAHYQTLWGHFCQMNEHKIEQEDDRVELEDYILERDKEIDKKALKQSLSYVEVLQRAYYARLNELMRLGQNHLHNIPCLDFPAGWQLNTWDYTDENFDKMYEEYQEAL